MRNVLIVIFAVIGSLSMQAATRTTVTDGNLLVSSKWDCGCVPSSGDDLIINHRMNLWLNFNAKSIKINPGASLTTHSGNLVVYSFIRIETGAELKNNSMVIFKKDYYLYGLHSGLGEVRFDGNGILYGSGTFTNNKGAKFNNGNFSIHSSANLNFSLRSTQFKNTVKVYNYGTFTVGQVIAGGFIQFHNYAGATLRFKITPGTTGNWNFHYPGNTVEYIGRGTAIQYIIQPTVAYDKLVLQGSGLGTVKTLNGQIQINNELKIETCTFDVRKAGVDHTVHLAGDWNNVSGRFLARGGNVGFIGSGTIYTFSGIESFYSMSITGDHSLISNVNVAGQMTVANTLRTNGYTIHMTGNWNCGGNFVADLGQVIFEGTTVSTITGDTDFDDLVINKTGAGSAFISSGNTGVYETLHLNTGTFNTNGLLYIRSNSTRTGRIGEIGAATLVGDVTVERFMNTPTNNWHLIGSPISGSSLNQWKNDFITTGFPGSNYPTYWFNNITFYNEAVSGHKDLGVYNCTNITNPIPNGVGVRAYVAGGTNKLTAKGTPIMGPFAWSLSYTNSGSAQDDGWNLISNPYASTIDWDDNTNWSKSNLKDAVYVYVAESGTFTSYIAGLGTNGGSQYIPSSQAFWVQTDGAAPALSMVEAAKSDVDQTYRNYTNINAFKVRMTTSGDLKDEMAIRFHEDATMDFDGNLDAYEFKSSDLNMPSLGLRGSDDILASIFSLAPIQETTSIPMELYVGLGGTVYFDVQGMVSCPWINSCAIYDAQTETTYNLRQGQPTGIEMEAGDFTNRYFLVLQPVTADQGPSHGLAEQDPNINNAIQMYIQGDDLVIMAQVGSEAALTNVSIHNVAGQLLLDKRQMNLMNQQRLNIQGLKGILLIQLTQEEKIISVNKLVH
jgi:hypothetical protein